MKTLSPKASLWIPSIFAACISAMILVPAWMGILPLSYGINLLVCFGPIGMMMIAQTTYNYVSLLEARIRELERQMVPRNV